MSVEECTSHPSSTRKDPARVRVFAMGKYNYASDISRFFLCYKAAISNRSAHAQRLPFLGER